MKIILLSYKLSPLQGSEFAVAWNYLRMMSKYHEYYVIYGRDVNDMETWIAEHPAENIHYYHVDVPNSRYANFTKWLYRHEKYMGFYLMYKLWHKEAYLLAQRLVREEEINLIHYLNPIGFKEPSECWKIREVPYVWGPIQGVQNWPIRLLGAVSLKGKVEALYRLIAHNAVLVGSLRVRCAVKRADHIYGVSHNTLRQFKFLFRKELEYLPENGIVKMMTDTPVKREAEVPLRLIWVGKFEDRKCIRILLDSLGRIGGGKSWELTVCGGGSDIKVRQLIKKYNIAQNVHLMGKLRRDEVQRCFQQSHLHVISSLQEATTTVLLEAMSWGVPTLTLDHCGMGAVVCEKCGIKIPVHSYNQVVHDMTFAISTMIEHPENVERLSLGVLECSKQYLWENRIKRFNDVYESLSIKYNEH